ncbi:PepSY-associated TM helix domain-containing protein [Rhodococcus rhodochrous]|uniref:PepSY domain-containing protein n=1 Tax=Rhodococcus rhodochrous TaxID=1829 RepID=A0AA46WRS2_RHORH|nr:PepSY domain-containing protein [Rhodococcus rhodochrous]UZF43007.1 PepSY domain-containing protein [Rhodococcus rhodochrous]
MSVPKLDRGTDAADTSAAEPARSAAQDSSPPRSMRPLIMRLHFYAGVLVAPFLLIATISGGLYAIAPTLEQVLYRDLLHVDSTGPALPLVEQVRAAQQLRPDLTVSAVRPASEVGETTRVLFTDPSLGESERTAVFIDPVTASSTGESVVYGSSSALPVRTWISQLHRHLHLGEPGRIYSELAASWLWVIALGGVYLWVQRYRTQRTRNRQSARLWTFDRTTQGRNRTLGWHGTTGLWIAVGLTFLSATGLTWSKYAGENVGELRTALSWTTPALDKTLRDSASAVASDGHDGHGGHGAAAADPGALDRTIADLDSAVAVAAENQVTGKVEATIPADEHTAITVTETRQPWQFATDAIAIDPATGAVTDVNRFADWPLAAKLTTWGIALHMGILFGLVNQLVLLALAVALATVIVRGYQLWWQRRPTRGSRRVARPPLRGTWRRLHPVTVVAVVAAAVAIGWFAPLLGLSLLAFVLVDVAVGLLQRRRSPEHSPEGTFATG